MKSYEMIRIEQLEYSNKELIRIAAMLHVEFEELVNKVAALSERTKTIVDEKCWPYGCDVWR